MRRHQEILIFGLSLCLAAAVWAAPPDPLQGIWKGKLHRHFVYETLTHQAVYVEDLDLTLLVSDKDVSGHGTAHLSNPSITRPRFDRRYAQWSTSYDPPTFGFLVKGDRTGEGQWLQITFTSSTPVKAHFHYHDIDGSTNVLLGVPKLSSQSIPWTDSTVGHFVCSLDLPLNGSLELPEDLAYFGENILSAEVRTEGDFEKVHAPAILLPSWAILTGLLAYVGLVLPGLTRWPDSARMMSILGTLLGTLYALESLGHGKMAHFARIAGFTALGLIWVLERARLHRQGQSAWREIFSALVDLAVVAASLYAMIKTMDLSITVAAGPGPVGAVGFAVFFGALITYALSFVAVVVKRIRVKTG